MTRLQRQRPLPLLAVLIVLWAIAISACSGGDGEDQAEEAVPPPVVTTVPPPPEPITEAVEPPPSEPSAPEPAPSDPPIPPPEPEPAPIPEPEEPIGDPIKIGIIADCEGPFSVWFEDSIGGAQLPLIERGATTTGPNPSDGIEAAVVAGRPIEIVGYGCGADSATVAGDEVRRLVGELGAEIVIGGVSGAEGVAIANYSLERPDVTFIDGTSAAQATTLAIQSENFFRWSTDFAQWSGGLGEYVFDEQGWRDAIVIAQDTSVSRTSAAGFIVEFCGVGGQVTDRLWPVRGQSALLLDAAQLSPDQNVFLALSGPILLEFLRAYEALVAPIDPSKLAGDFSFRDPLLFEEFGDRVHGVATSDSIWADSESALATAYGDLVEETYPSIGPSAHTAFVYNYYVAAEAMALALEQVEGVLESDGHQSFRHALQGLVLEDAPYGPIRLDENRQAIAPNFVKVMGPRGPETVRIVPSVSQDFGGAFSAVAPPPSRDNPSCEPREIPWIGTAVPVNSEEDDAG